ncbi:MAG: hypothetical protein HFJ38_04530 [Bacilli bacterium]|nr:hypothetical protein [Bacilli bacterium]
MNNLINFLQSKEAIMVYIIASIISVIYIIYYYLRKTKITRLQRQNTMELNKIMDKVNLNVEVDKEIQVSPIEPEKTNRVSPSTIEIEKKEENLQTIVKEVEVEALEIEEESISIEVTPSLIEEKINLESNTCNTDFVYQPVNMKVEGTIEVLENEETVPILKEETSVKMTNIEKKQKLEEVLKKIYPKENLEKVELIDEQNTVELPVINIDNLLAEDGKNTKEEIIYTSTVPDIEEAKKELEEVTKKLEQEEKQAITLTEFEQLQEDTAIISLDELMEKAGTMYEINEQVQYKDEGNEPISISDLEKRKQEMLSNTQQIQENPEKIEENIRAKKSPSARIIKNTKEKIFKSSRVISPVYGMKKSTELELENTANYEKLDEEIRKTNEFLATLKELQKKLD